MILHNSMNCFGENVIYTFNFIVIYTFNFIILTKLLIEIYGQWSTILIAKQLFFSDTSCFKFIIRPYLKFSVTWFANLLVNHKSKKAIYGWVCSTFGPFWANCKFIRQIS